MKNLIKFLLFITYSSVIFFLNNNIFLLIPVFLNICLMFISKVKIKKVLYKVIKVLPFIAFTCIVNCILDNLNNAIWIGIKLSIVCHITIVYSESKSIAGIADTIKILCIPLIIFKVNIENIKVMICISLSAIPIMKKNLYEIKESCIAKNISFNIKNMKIIMTKFLLSLILRVNEIEESLIAKGYSSE